MFANHFQEERLEEETPAQAIGGNVLRSHDRKRPPDEGDMQKTEEWDYW